MRSVQIHLLATPEEAREIKNKAERAGLSVTRYVIEACRRRVVRGANMELVRELRRIGVMLNHIARSCSEGKWVMDPRPIREQLRQIEDALGKIAKEGL